MRASTLDRLAVLPFWRHTHRDMVNSFARGLWAGVGAVGALGFTVAAYRYAAMWPCSRIFGRTLIAPDRPGELTLTFDDGPNPAWTPRLLEILAHHQVLAAFFVVGSHANIEPELVRRISKAGHTVGNHSWSHPNLSVTSAKRVREELRRTTDRLQQITGQPVRYFRPPFGGRRPVVITIARELGMTPVLWNAITSDWKEGSAEKIALQLSAKIDRLRLQGHSANLVLHDGDHSAPSAFRRPSVDAADYLIKRYINTHRFVTLDTWAGGHQHC
jgi:peptidoglycan/xylan/chitin deacetylase (PgdA/CDA1 family)